MLNYVLSCYIVPTASVRDISVSVASPTSVELSWLPPARDHWKGVIDHYQVTAARQGPVDGRKRRQTSAIVTKNVPPQNNHRDPSLASEPLQMESYVLQGLEEFFEYSISVQPVNAAGSGPTNPPILQNMPEAGIYRMILNIATVHLLCVYGVLLQHHLVHLLTSVQQRRHHRSLSHGLHPLHWRPME